ncbi:MAG: CHAT domain-containing protein [Cyanobacteria bacterium J06634_6]
MLPLALDNQSYYRNTLILLGVSLLAILKTDLATAQSVTAASDGTGTRIRQSEQQYDVEGGQLSASGDNLFHSFRTFQPNAGETVNFETTPSVQNVFARVRGEQPSVINGELQVSGSQADLFLMSPSGILFGPEATLNLPANFTATTANAIGIGNSDDWFNATGINDYAALGGEAHTFAFASDHPGVVVNEGELTLNEGQQLSVLAGNTINSGTLRAPGGTVTMAAVPGENIVRISQAGQVLSLDVAESSLQTQTELGVNSPTFDPLRLPGLLTSSSVSEVTQLTVNANGTVNLTAAGNVTPSVIPSTCVASGCAIATGLLDVSNTKPPSLPANTPQAGGTVSLFGDYVDLSNANIDVSGITSNGNLVTETFTPSETISLPNTQNLNLHNLNTDQLSTLSGKRNQPGSMSRRASGQNGELQTERGINRQRSQSSGLKVPGGRGLHPTHRAVLGNASANAALAEIENERVQDFSDYFGRQLHATELTPETIQSLLSDVNIATNRQSTLVYIKAPSTEHSALVKNTSTEDPLSTAASTPLEILIFTATGDPVSITVPNISPEQLSEAAIALNNTLITSVRRNTTSYLAPAQQLYQWLIQPIEDELGPDAINNILFSMDTGLRSLPIAALHDGEQFLIEKYSVGMVPSLSLIDAEYQPVERTDVLAMGASSFEVLQPLAAVPTEIETIGQLWQSESFLNESFTLQNLVNQQSQQPAQIIHLATHAEFNPGTAENSYIQLWDEQLHLSDIHTLGWDLPAVDLLVLSACQTAVGNAEAEMGFAGLSVASGVNSALASLWSVSDLGTLALMSEFYDQLRTAPLKSEALQLAQLSMLNGDTRVESGQLFSTRTRSTALPPTLSTQGNPDLSHPYYWSGFTMIGSPW